MAKFTIQHCCGHECRHDVPAKDRESQVSWLRSSLCPDCFGEQKRNERAQALHQEAAQARIQAATLGLPPLTGTEKQLTFAEVLRLGVVEAALRPRPRSAPEKITLIRQIVEDTTRERTKAGWWIRLCKEEYHQDMREPRERFIERGEREIRIQSPLVTEQSAQVLGILAEWKAYQEKKAEWERRDVIRAEAKALGLTGILRFWCRDYQERLYGDKFGYIHKGKPAKSLKKNETGIEDAILLDFARRACECCRSGKTIYLDDGKRIQKNPHEPLSLPQSNQQSPPTTIWTQTADPQPNNAGAIRN